MKEIKFLVIVSLQFIWKAIRAVNDVLSVLYDRFLFDSVVHLCYG